MLKKIFFIIFLLLGISKFYAIVDEIDFTSSLVTNDKIIFDLENTGYTLKTGHNHLDIGKSNIKSHYNFAGKAGLLEVCRQW